MNVVPDRPTARIAELQSHLGAQRGASREPVSIGRPASRRGAHRPDSAAVSAGADASAKAEWTISRPPARAALRSTRATSLSPSRTAARISRARATRRARRSRPVAEVEESLGARRSNASRSNGLSRVRAGRARTLPRCADRPDGPSRRAHRLECPGPRARRCAAGVWGAIGSSRAGTGPCRRRGARRARPARGGPARRRGHGRHLRRQHALGSRTRSKALLRRAAVTSDPEEVLNACLVSDQFQPQCRRSAPGRRGGRQLARRDRPAALHLLTHPRRRSGCSRPPGRAAQMPRWTVRWRVAGHRSTSTRAASLRYSNIRRGRPAARCSRSTSYRPRRESP